MLCSGCVTHTQVIVCPWFDVIDRVKVSSCNGTRGTRQLVLIRLLSAISSKYHEVEAAGTFSQEEERKKDRKEGRREGGKEGRERD